MTHLARTGVLKLAHCTVGAGLMVIAQIAVAGTPSHGELAAAIRGADRPCAHVQGVKAVGENAWSVQCNSGQFRVIRKKDGSFSVE